MLHHVAYRFSITKILLITVYIYDNDACGRRYRKKRKWQRLWKWRPENRIWNIVPASLEVPTCLVANVFYSVVSPMWNKVKVKLIMYGENLVLLCFIIVYLFINFLLCCVYYIWFLDVRNFVSLFEYLIVRKQKQTKTQVYNKDDAYGDKQSQF